MNIRVNILPEGIVLDASSCTEDTAEIVVGLRVELAKLAQGEYRYTDVIIRANPVVLAFLRLIRWDAIFDFQEINEGNLVTHEKRQAYTFNDNGVR